MRTFMAHIIGIHHRHFTLQITAFRKLVLLPPSGDRVNTGTLLRLAGARASSKSWTLVKETEAVSETSFSEQGLWPVSQISVTKTIRFFKTAGVNLTLDGNTTVQIWDRFKQPFSCQD